MKLKGFSWFVWKEFRTSWVWYAFSTFLLTLLLLTIGIIYSSIHNSVGAFYDYINMLDEDGLVIELRGLHYLKVDQVSELGLKEVFVDTDTSFPVKPYLSVRGEQVSLDEFNVRLEYNRGLLNHEVVVGRPFVAEDNEKNVIWISEDVAKKYQLVQGDMIESRFSDTTKSYKYEIVGIFDRASEDADILLPFMSYYQAATENGKYVDHTVYGVIEDARDTSKIYSQLRKKGIVPSSRFDDMLKMLEMVSTLMRILVVVMAIFVGWTFANILSVILKRRMRSLLQYRMLGMDGFQINFIFLTFVFIMLITGIALSVLLSGLYSDYVRNLVKNALHIVVSVNNDTSLILVECLGGVIISGITVVRVFRMISSMDLMELVEEQNS